MKKKILIYGPYLINLNKKKAYGGGTGGYTRSMNTYVKYFKPNDFDIIPCYYTFRGQLNFDNFIWRFIVDSFSFTKNLIVSNCDLVHILGQYRKATVREFFVVLISKLFKRKVAYQIIAGVFEEWCTKANFIEKFMIKYIVNNSDLVFAEGEIYLPFLKKSFKNNNYIYLPNFVPNEIIPSNSRVFNFSGLIKVLFVGFCYEAKGIKEMVNALNELSSSENTFELNLVGHESEEIKKYLDKIELNPNFYLNRHGKQDFEFVLKSYKDNFIYCYPSRHKGEGHNNSVNEAMMNEMIIIASKQGFLGSIITSDVGYSIDNTDVSSIKSAFNEILSQKNLAIEKAKRAKLKLEKKFTTDVNFKIILDSYKSVLK